MLFSGSLHGATALGNLDPSVTTLQATTSVEAIEKGKPAQGALRPGDKIVAVEGRTATGESAKRAIEADVCTGAPTNGCRAARPVTLTVLRGGQRATVSIYPRYSAEAGKMVIGVFFGAAPKSFGVLSAAGAAVSEMWHVTTQTLTNFGRALTQPKVRHELHSIVGISEVGHETFAAGAGYALVFLGFLSLVLAVINLFPFLPLDGGHIVWSLAEKVRGRRISLMAMYRFSSVGIVLLLFLVINGVSNDIGRLTG